METEMIIMEPDLTKELRMTYESIARRCARGVRGCATDDQYSELLDRVVEALAFASGNIKRVN